MMIQKKEPFFIHGLITVLCSVLILFFSLVIGKSEPQIPLLLCCLTAGLMASYLGYRWEEILQAVTGSISQAIEAILILCLIGILTGCWVASGTVPAIIYYGLRLIRADFFLPATAILCGILSYILGAWGTVGTIGLALMGIGIGFGIPAPQVAGAVITGSYLGEVISPFSDATNFTAAVIGKNVISITGKTLRYASVGFCLAIGIFWFLGRNYQVTDAQMQAGVEPLLQSISGNFRISFLTFLPLILMVAAVLRKVPAIVALILGILSAAVIAVTVQGEKAVELFPVCFQGYISNTGNALTDTLLTAGGLESMMFTIAVILFAMAFGGIMNETGQMAALIRPLCKRIQSSQVLNSAVVFCCILMNVLMPDQYLAISLPGQMFREEYQKRKIELTELAGALLLGGAVTSPIVPWNTCGIYCSGILGVQVSRYMKFSLISLIFPVICIAGGFLSAKKRENEKRRQDVKSER